MTKLIKRFLKDEQGLELSEYAVMAALIIIAILLAIGGLRGAIVQAFTDTTATINSRP